MALERFISGRWRNAALILAAALVLSGGIAASFMMAIKERASLKPEDPRIEIRKSERTLTLFDGDRTLRTYRIGLGSQPVGDKEIEGDGRTPEGDFRIFVKNPNSRFFLSVGLNYPLPEDAHRGLRSGFISNEERDAIVEAHESRSAPPQKTALGGEIYIHGHGSGSDWTEGCIALEDDEMKELFDAVSVGTPVRILP
ncbi:MAG: L,D-transpeptidase [Aridibacter famidurans]|nr:L,D-transpeptidase [Aridibacter famidurans]